jgi:DNA-directed RNA polymerase II subunit RPB2
MSNEISSNQNTFNETFNIRNDPFIETPWKIIESYFKNQHLECLVRHQIESYNNFIGYQILKTIEMFNPINIKSDDDYNSELDKYSLEIFISFENFRIYRPQIHENNGAIKLMFPQEARLRNFTYSGTMTIDMNIKIIVRDGENLETVHTHYKTIPEIHIGKMPIMLKSNSCVLTQHKNIHTGECKYDAGGYFIINGSEKTVLGQERAAENKIYVFNIQKVIPKYSWTAEIKSVPDYKCISPKQINMYILSKNNGFGFPIVIQIPRVKQPLPLFVIFRALGVISDKEICEYILLNIENEQYSEMFENLHASIIDANKYMTYESSIKLFTSNVSYTSAEKVNREVAIMRKQNFALEVLQNDLFPHCQTIKQKLYYLGYMAHKLMLAKFGFIKDDDRDSYLNKRIDLTGTSLNNLFRNLFNRLVKDIEKQVIKEIKTGSWRSKDDYDNIINLTNIYKIVKPTTIENGIKRALATGDFGIKNTNSNKVGVAQVLNRLTYPSTLSHLRRVSTPSDKSGKLIPPRKLMGSSWGFMCPSETPEGGSIGIVKNLSYMAHVTIQSNSNLIHEFISKNTISIENLSPIEIFNKVKVFINGAFVAISENAYELYLQLKEMKYKGIINVYTSIIFDYKFQEIKICNDGGRVTRPLLKIKNNNLLINNYIIDNLSLGELSWDDLLTDCKLIESPIEYIDAEEQSWSLIATKPKDIIKKYDENIYKFTHCEIHPSTIFGTLASCIPFPEFNQSPRVTYQAAQGKQAMGIYATNYHERMDKTAYILNYPMRPLTDTRIMNIIKLNEIPSGCNAIVAIMTHTGYNQEDSILVNKASIDRGLFQITLYHTEKDEDKQQINGDEEIRCKPEKQKTKGMKMGANYNKVNSKGLIPENTLVENRDIIIAKVMPIKENRNDHTKTIKYEDKSKMYRTDEETYIDKNYIDKNGDGYSFAKVRLRTTRKPNIGDKFCALPTQQVLTNKGWIEIKDINIEEHMVCSIDGEGNMIYEYPTAKFEYDHDDVMYHVENKQVNIICTLNHKLYVQKRSSDKYELIEAQNVMGKMVRFKKSMKNIKEDVEYMELENEKYLMDDWLKLIGIFIADGYADNNIIYITALKQRKINFMVKLLTNMNLLYTYSNDGKYNIYKSNNPELFKYFKILSVGSFNKYLPKYYLNLSERQSRILLESLISGDGSSMIYKDSTFNRYYTISPQLANDVSQLSVHSGYSSIIKIKEEPRGIKRVGKRNLGIRAGQEVCVELKHTYYSISIISKQNQPWINKKNNESNIEELIHYTGKVYCIEMPTSHTYYMRENNFSPSLIIGNSSRHSQKGTTGNIIPEEDMPFTADGIRPDIIINPHCIPSRMTMGQLKETLLCKVLVQLGLFGDGTSFGNLDVGTISEKLAELGYEGYGNEIMYNGATGEQFECSTFIGPIFYQRLKHMVNDKKHSRSIGPMVNLTRQPAEGRSRDGGLKFGEMEKDAMVSHGASAFTKSRMYDVSDKYSVHICNKCGLLASYNDKVNIHLCRTCDNRTDFSYVQIPYSCKLLFQELMTMNVVPRMITEK